MSKKALVILIFIIAGLILFAKHNAEKRQQKTGIQSEILLSYNPDNIHKVSITSKEGKVQLEVLDDKWVCTSHYNYPANPVKISELIIRLAQMESSQMITSNSKNYDKLGLGEEKLSVTLQDKDGKIVGGMDFGKERTQTRPGSDEEGGMYVKPVPGEEVFLVKSSIDMETQSQEWLLKKFLAIEEKSIERIELLTTNPLLSIEQVKGTEAKENESGKEEQPVLKLKGMKEGDKEKEWAVNAVARTFGDLSFANVFPQNDERFKDKIFNPLLKIYVSNNTVYSFSGIEENGAFYIKAEASLSEKEQTDEIKKEVTSLNAKFSEWIFQMESWDASNFKKEYKDLVEEPSKQDQETSSENDNEIDPEAKSIDTNDEPSAIPTKESIEKPQISEDVTPEEHFFEESQESETPALENQDETAIEKPQTSEDVTPEGPLSEESRESEIPVLENQDETSIIETPAIQNPAQNK